MPINRATDNGGVSMAEEPRNDAEEGDHRHRLRDLEARLAEARRDKSGPSRGEEHFSQANHAWRMVIELVSGLGIGFAIGYGLDVLLGTLPILLVLFTLLGFAAGIKTMLRTAAELGKKPGGKDDNEA